MTAGSSQRSVGVVPVVAVLSVFLLGDGAMAFGASPLGGAWLALSGLCLLLSGVVAIPWVASGSTSRPPSNASASAAPRC